MFGSMVFNDATMREKLPTCDAEKFTVTNYHVSQLLTLREELLSVLGK